MSKLDKAIRLASQVFEGKFDKGGKPYILHCLYVMMNTQSTDDDVLCAAVLHDILEDTPYNPEDLRQEGFSEKTIDLIRILTHAPNHSYDEYIRIIGVHKDATAIKLADLKHNSDITRLKDVRKKDFDRLQKYCMAYKYLSN